MTDFILIGSGGHAGNVIDAIESNGDRVLALLDDFATIGELRYGRFIAGKVDDADKICGELKCRNVFVAVGTNSFREESWLKINKLGLNMPCVIHSSANVSPSAQVGLGAFVGANAFVGSRAVVKSHSILNCGAILSHDSILGHCSHMSSNSCAGGQVEIGERTYIGLGASIKDGVKIGHDCIIGHGSTVLFDVKDHSNTNK